MIPCEHAFPVRTNQSRAHTSFPSSSGRAHSGLLSPAQITPGQGPDNKGPQSQLEFSTLVNPKSASLYLFLPVKTTVKAIGARAAPSLPLLWTDPGASPGGPPLGVCEHIELSFQWQPSADLMALPYLKNNKTCTLKQCAAHRGPWVRGSGGAGIWKTPLRGEPVRASAVAT